MKDLYKILGVDKSADQHDIRSAYKLKARSVHPDKEGGSTEAFQDLNEAYSILRDAGKRAKYDAGESTESKPSINEVAMARLASLFQQGIATADDSIDLIEALRSEVAQASLSMQNDIETLRSSIKKYQYVLDRVEYTGDGNDIFTGQVNLSIASMNDSIDRLSYEIDVSKEVVCMLNDYKCSFEKVEPVYSRPSGFGGGLWGGVRTIG